MSETMVAKEVAEAEFDRLAKHWDILDVLDELDKDDKASFTEQRGRVIRAIRKGIATVDDNGEVDFALQYSSGDLTSLHFSVPKGSAYMDMDKHKEQKGMHKIGTFLAAMTGQPERTFHNMDSRDIKFCQAMALLFLGS